MRLEIHYKIAKKICGELKGFGIKLNETLFLFGNFFPDLIHSYFWCRHEYPVSRDYLHKKIENLKKRPLFFSFQLGVLTHYISDYFCYPHSRVYDKGILDHIKYEISQKAPEEFLKIRLNIKHFAVEELDKFVAWYEKFRPVFRDDEQDFHMAVLVSSGFLKAAYEWSPAENLNNTMLFKDLFEWEGQYPAFNLISV